MIPALILIAILVVVGALLYVHYRLTGGDKAADNAEAAADSAAAESEECCGMHITCERDSLLASVSEKIEYYDDEELDAYAGRAADEYSDTEIEQFREVLLTLQPEDIAGWARSVQLRGITLPSEIRDELLLIVAEARTTQL